MVNEVILINKGIIFFCKVNVFFIKYVFFNYVFDGSGFVNKYVYMIYGLQECIICDNESKEVFLVVKICICIIVN